jgi:hypothetical protein
LPDFLRHARDSTDVTLDILEVLIASDRIERAKSLPDVPLIGGDIR